MIFELFGLYLADLTIGIEALKKFILLFRWLLRWTFADHRIESCQDLILASLSINWRLYWDTHSIEHDHAWKIYQNEEGIIDSNFYYCQFFILVFDTKHNYSKYRVKKVGEHWLADKDSINAYLFGCIFNFTCIYVWNLCLIILQ